MSTVTMHEAVLWTAALAACLPAWTVLQRHDRRRRVWDLLDAPGGLVGPHRRPAWDRWARLWAALVGAVLADRRWGRRERGRWPYARRLLGGRGDKAPDAQGPWTSERAREMARGAAEHPAEGDVPRQRRDAARREGGGGRGRGRGERPGVGPGGRQAGAPRESGRRRDRPGAEVAEWGTVLGTEGRGRDLAGGGREHGLAARLRAGRVECEWLCVAAGAGLGAVTWSPVPLAAGVAAMPLVRGALRRRATRALAERTAAAVAALCGTVAGDLRAGRPPNAALAEAVQGAGWAASQERGEVGRLLLSAARFGGDVPEALRTAAGRGPGAQGLRAVAACWQVAVDGGAGLAAALDRVASALRAEADQREDLRAQLEGPRSTAVLLALLPAFGLFLGTVLGARPVGVLLHTPAGLALLGLGMGLEWAGLAWTARIIAAAEGSPARSGGGAGAGHGGRAETVGRGGAVEQAGAVRGAEYADPGWAQEKSTVPWGRRSGAAGRAPGRNRGWGGGTGLGSGREER